MSHSLFSQGRMEDVEAYLHRARPRNGGAPVNDGCLCACTQRLHARDVIAMCLSRVSCVHHCTSLHNSAHNNIFRRDAARSCAAGAQSRSK